MRTLVTLLVFACAIGQAIASPDEDVVDLDQLTELVKIKERRCAAGSQYTKQGSRKVVSCGRLRGNLAECPNAISKATLLFPQTWAYVTYALGNQILVNANCDVTGNLAMNGNKATVGVSLAVILGGSKGNPVVDKVVDNIANMKGVVADKQALVLTDIKTGLKQKITAAIATAKKTTEPDHYDPDFEEKQEAKTNSPSSKRICTGYGVATRLALMFPKYLDQISEGYLAVPKSILFGVGTYTTVWAKPITRRIIKGGVACDMDGAKLSHVHITFNAIRLYFLGNFGSQTQKTNFLGRMVGKMKNSCQDACGGFEDWDICIGAIGGPDTPGVNVRITLSVSGEQTATEAVTVRKERMTLIPRKIQVANVELLSKLDAADGPKFEGFPPACKQKYLQMDTIAKVLNGEDQGNLKYSLAEQIKKSITAYIKGEKFPRGRYHGDEVRAILTDH